MCVKVRGGKRQLFVLHEKETTSESMPSGFNNHTQKVSDSHSVSLSRKILKAIQNGII